MLFGWPLVVAAMLLPVALMLVPYARAKLALKRFQAAFDRADAAGMERAARQLQPFLKPVDRAFLQIAIFEAQELWAEARNGLLAIDRAQLDEQQRVTVDNDVAWCLLHEGQPEAALPLAQSAVSRAPQRSRANCLGTLGAALQLCGRPAEALGPLREAVALGGRARNQAIRNYYIGECLAALKRDDEAQQAFAVAVQLAPDSHFGRRAQARLQSLTHLPYR